MIENITPAITIITPTTGKDTLFNLIETITRQDVPVNHILLWDDKRDDKFSLTSEQNPLNPEYLDKKEYWKLYGYRVNNIVIKGNIINGIAAGSALRAIGLMAANTDLVTFADDDVMWDDGHLTSMMQAIENKNWAYCKRKIWKNLRQDGYELIGVDEFESIGEDSKLSYKMVDNNCMMFRRRFGVSGACLYREVTEYCDDRLFYKFLMEYAGPPAQTGLATVNQVCPDRLIEFFTKGCTKINT